MDGGGGNALPLAACLLTCVAKLGKGQGERFCTTNGGAHDEQRKGRMGDGLQVKKGQSVRVKELWAFV